MNRMKELQDEIKQLEQEERLMELEKKVSDMKFKKSQNGMTSKAVGFLKGSAPKLMKKLRSKKKRKLF